MHPSGVRLHPLQGLLLSSIDSTPAGGWRELQNLGASLHLSQIFPSAQEPLCLQLHLQVMLVAKTWSIYHVTSHCPSLAACSRQLLERRQ